MAPPGPLVFAPEAGDLRTMKTGALVMMDALGFRDVWREPGGGERVIKKMRKLRDAAIERMARWGALANELREHTTVPVPDVSFLSDTIVISLPLDESQGDALIAVRTAAFTASTIAATALQTEPRILYRGCVTIGEFAVDDHFIVGKAVSTAASLYERAQGAFVWLDSLACAPFAGIDDERVISDGLCRWDVPLKCGDRYNTLAVIPFNTFYSSDERRELIGHASATFDRGATSIDVQVKKQRTLEFLVAADRAVEKQPLAGVDFRDAMEKVRQEHR
jgi:hypothetical protein